MPKNGKIISIILSKIQMIIDNNNKSFYRKNEY